MSRIEFFVVFENWIVDEVFLLIEFRVLYLYYKLRKMIYFVLSKR